MKIFITGGAGFGGSGIVHELLRKGYKITVLDITAPSHAELLQDVIDQINYLWKSVHDVSRYDLRGHDIILHFSAQADVPMGFPSPSWTIYQNVLGTLKLLEACRKVKEIKKVFLASSGNVLGRPKYLPIDENHPLTPHNPYAASKACQELLFLAYHRCYGIPIVIFRNGIIYGPNMRREIFIFKWLWNILNNKPCILEGGDQTRDPTYVSDTLNAWILGIESEEKRVVGETFQISFGKEYKVKDILNKCFKVCGKKVPVIRKPYRPGEKGQRECFDISKAKKILGYNPKVDLDEGLKKTVKWIKEKFKL